MDRRSFLAAAGAGLLSGKMYAADPGCSTGFPDVRSIAADLTTPPAIAAAPSPGVRARRALAAYAGTEVHHTLYLPSDWKPGKKYPVLVEYPGNGPYTSPCGDSSSGDVEDCNLGYGISAGQRFLWLALPFIDSSGKRNQRWWWGDVAATVNYCRKAVGEACHRFGGDPRSVILCGFSRGAIACNFIGLHDDSIAGLWLGFVASSHYDGVEHWDWEGSDPASARKRLYRLRGRAS
ncbi:MAG: hypothetical protein FWD64_01320, partial [Acidobacteriaceae bacterium]|nr:hypothetical protein [Acidobacteriaceae bacterium]